MFVHTLRTSTLVVVWVDLATITAIFTRIRTAWNIHTLTIFASVSFLANASAIENNGENLPGFFFVKILTSKSFFALFCHTYNVKISKMKENIFEVNHAGKIISDCLAKLDQH